MLPRLVCNRPGMMYNYKRIGKSKVFMRQGLPNGFLPGDLFFAAIQDMIDPLFHLSYSLICSAG
jgi:hypothetical protein